jgi:hypothetical protein
LLLDGDLVALSILKGFVVAITICYLYYSGKLMGAGRGYALLFALLSMVGYQSAVWWKLGTHEATGALLLAAALYYCLKYLSTNKTRWALVSVPMMISTPKTSSRENSKMAANSVAGRQFFSFSSFI